MIIVMAIVSVAVFILAFQGFGVARVTYGVKVHIEDAISIIRSKDLDERTREEEIQRVSLKLFGSFFSIIFRSILMFVAAFIPIGAGHLLEIADMSDVLRLLTRVDVIVVFTIVMSLGYFLKGRMKRSTASDYQVNYSAMDRLLHWIAFSLPSTQFIASDIENSVFRSVYRSAKADNPIFITSLPRAGTTLMLEVFSQFPSLASHSYRDMPFVMAPVLWSKLSGRFHKNSELRERAHADGMMIGYDSPEAFEEIIWRFFWPEKYSDTRIQLWSEKDVKSEASSFFREHMKKIVALRRPERLSDGRYISKNNGNIARLDLIGQMFPNANILIPVRQPLEQAYSLLYQHKNFTKMHKEEAFVQKYMADLGHYEFGALHRPIAFPELESFTSDRDPLALDYWLGYWIAAFQHIHIHRDKVTFISYEDTCVHGKRTVSELCRKFNIPTEGMLDTVVSLFRAPSPPKGNRESCDSELLNYAEELYKTILADSNTD